MSKVQRDVIGRAKRHAPYPTSYLGHPGKTLLQSLDRYKNVLSQAGITKKELGIVGHGLRHQFAGDKYFDLAKIACPVRGGDPLQDPELMERVLLAVSQQLGHNRTSISRAYLGSFNGKNQSEIKRDEKLIDPAVKDGRDSENWE